MVRYHPAEEAFNGFSTDERCMTIVLKPGNNISIYKSKKGWASCLQCYAES
jgi:hypothetical protein